MRSVKLDLGRGLLMIYIIILIHGGYWLRILPRPYASILLFEMPLIFMISGYTFGYTSRKQKGITMAYYWRYSLARLSRILLPYFAYSLVAALVVILTKNLEHTKDVFLSWLNPFSDGKGYGLKCINWHLWFVPPFIIVTLLMPFVKTKWVRKLPSLYVLVFLILLFSLLSYVESNAVTSVFYLIWALAGYILSEGRRISNLSIFLMFVGGILFLVMAKYGFAYDLNMQSNKFPPNLLFFIFSVIWVSFFLYLRPRFSTAFCQRLASNVFISLFIKHGYSLYLWQGLGYYTAWSIQEKYDIPVLFTWLIAIALTMVFGLVASPLEKIRWRQSKSHS